MQDYIQIIEKIDNYEHIPHSSAWKSLRQLKQDSKSVDQNLNMEFAIHSVNINNEKQALIPPFELYGISDENKQLSTYIEMRLSTSQNPYLKGLYSSILWHMTKNRKHAMEAITSYSEFINRIKDRTDFGWAMTIAFTLNQGIQISAAIKDSDNLKKFHTELINKITTSFRYSIFQQYYLVLIKNKDNLKKLLTDDELRITLDKLKYFSSKEKTKEILPNLEKGIKLFNDQRRLMRNELHETIGDFAYSLAQQHSGSFLYLHFMEISAKHYKDAGIKCKYEKVHILQEKYWKENHLNLFSKHTFQLPQKTKDAIIQERKSFDSNLTGIDPCLILAELCSIPNLYFNYEEARKFATNTQEPIFFQLACISQYNESGNIVDTINPKDDHENFMIHQYLDFSTTLNIIPLSFIAIRHLLTDPRMNDEYLLNIIENFSLFPNIDYIKQQVMDSLTELLNRMRIRLNTGSIKSPSLITGMDSLALKAEGLIRELLFRNSIDIKKTTKTNDNQEMNIIDFLNKPELKQFYRKNDLEFIKYILIDQKGFNLRNIIAHNLSPDIYTLENGILLSLTILILIFNIQDTQ